MQNILLVFHIFLAIGLVGLVLIQHGRGADAGAAFGSGASSTIFGARGASSFLTRTTGILATLFFLTSLMLAYFANRSVEPQSIMGQVQQQQAQEAPQAPAGPGTDVPALPVEAPPSESGTSSDAPTAPEQQQ